MRIPVVLLLVLVLISPAAAQVARTWAWWVVERGKPNNRLAGPFYALHECEADAKTRPSAECVMGRD